MAGVSEAQILLAGERSLQRWCPRLSTL